MKFDIKLLREVMRILFVSAVPILNGLNKPKDKPEIQMKSKKYICSRAAWRVWRAVNVCHAGNYGGYSLPLIHSHPATIQTFACYYQIRHQ